MYLYIDIETVPDLRLGARERVLEAAKEKADSGVPPKNYTHEASIERWRQRQIEAAAAEAEEDWRRTALNANYGQIVCVCWAFGDGPIDAISRAPNGYSEATVLTAFLDKASAALSGQTPTWVGYNIGFDLRFLHHRAIILDVPRPFHIPHNSPAWRGDYIDLMFEWCGLRDSMKLTELCDVLGIDVEDEIDGAGVYDAWLTDPDKVVQHCIADVERVRAIHKRLRRR